MSLTCQGPVWRLDDFSRCFQHTYLQTLLPLIAVAISLLWILYQLLTAPWRVQSQKLQGAIDSTGKYVNPNGFLSNPDHPDGEDTDSDDSEDNALRPTVSRAQHSTFTIDKPKGELLIPVFEELVVAGALAVEIYALISGAWGNKNGWLAAIAGIVAWGYILGLTTIRLLASSTPRLSVPSLWYHTFSLYFIEWVCAALLFRSQIIHPQSDLARTLAIAHFSLVTTLNIIALCSRMGNAVVALEYEDDLIPSKEATASAISLLTFSWLDSLIVQGFKKNLDLKQVWNLLPEDKAAKLLADYRQVKKTHALALHLLRFFEGPVLLQGAYAAVVGVLTFVPTVLLKVILEYVEDPSSSTPSSSWFFVILLFVSTIFSATCAGQAFFIGRKVCIHLRAIMIGEVYAKALRRRAAASTATKVLGEAADSKPNDDGEGQKKGLMSKISGLFKKKETKDDTQDTPSKADAKKDTVDPEQVSSGTIINLMAVDSFKVAEICAYLHFLWAETPVQLVLAIYLLYEVLGYSSIAGIIMMAVLTPVNYIISKQFATRQKTILQATDARIHITNEVLTNIRIIKYFAWEQRFLGQIDEKRVEELRQIRNRYIVWAFAVVVWSGAPLIITFFTFLVYTVVEQRPLIPSVAFTALSLFGVLRIPLDQLADMVAHVQEAKVSVDRIEEFLNEPETAKYEILKPDQLDENGEQLIGFENTTLSWGSEGDDDFKLFDMDFNFKVGKLNVIVGATGSGKTSMLMGLLGEMTLLSGNVFLPGSKAREDLRADPETGLTESVAYCAQQAWLLNGTVKDNIVFAGKFDKARYKAVIDVCALKRDLEILDNGDQTLVGEKGVTLSGGQKQRISLARAMYSTARHILLDDVLSAVDAHTAKWIFDKALTGPLMRGRTCLLVTHNVSLCVPQADFAVVLDNGKVVAYGTADEVMDSGKLSEDLTKSRTASAMPSRVASPSPSDGAEADASAGAEVTNAENIANAASADHGEGVEPIKAADNGPSAELELEEHTPASVPEETRAYGRVKTDILLLYFSSMGGIIYWGLTFVLFVIHQIATLGTNIWIREWANAYRDQEYVTPSLQVQSSDINSSWAAPVQTSSTLSYECIRSGACLLQLVAPSWGNKDITIQAEQPKQDVDDSYYLSVYAIIALAYVVLTFLRMGFVFYGSLTASSRIHRRLIDTVVRAKFRFFDSTPLGQIVNRFSKDIEQVDQQIAPIAEGVVHSLASIIAVVVLISVILPQFLIAAAFISILYFAIGALYIACSRDLKRLESLQRSPLFQQFGETLSGMTTIRAYNDERRFIRDNLQKVNTHSRPFIFLWAANRWLALRVDYVGALVSFVTAAFVISNVGKIDAGAAGLAMTYAISFTENVVWVVRLYSMNEQNMNAVERIKEYYDVEKEAEPIVETNRPPANWPAEGSVEFIGYSTRYRKDFDFVLKNITFKILPGEKIGVVGRTGAGKSSLALALFRALEAEQGKILVDAVDIGLIGLQDLRENIVMVPQDPTLFTGTIRNNLDPFNLYTDEEIFESLRRVQLISSPNGSPPPGSPAGKQSKADQSSAPKIVVEATSSDATSSDDTLAAAENKNIFLNLSSHVAESGSNLSQGQRQLLCLARALLKAPKVLLMDEATASIDYATDAKIQETLREFKNTTLTIAHRLQTIIDYDKVLVLDRGEVIEYGSPLELITKKDGTFKGMCDSSGDFDLLLQEARKAAKSKKLVDDE